MLQAGAFAQIAVSAMLPSSLVKGRSRASTHCCSTGTAKKVQEKAQYCKLITNMNS